RAWLHRRRDRPARDAPEADHGTAHVADQARTGPEAQARQHPPVVPVGFAAETLRRGHGPTVAERSAFPRRSASPRAKLRHNARMPNRRPQLQLIAPSASPEEAAAVVAALERFMRATAPAAAPARQELDGWVRA